MVHSKKANTGTVLLMVLGLFFAVLYGLISAVFNGWIALLLFAPVLPVLFVLRDFRVGVVLLIVLMPLQNSPVLPQFSGFNLVNYMVIATFGSLMLHHFFAKDAVLVQWPRIFWWAYLLPIFAGTLLAIPHLKSVPQVQELIVYSSTYIYVTSVVIKPLFAVLVAWMLGAAVIKSKRPGLFLIPLAVSAVVPALLVFVFLAKTGLSLTVLGSARSRELLGSLGMHANVFGQFFGLAYTILLFISPLATRLREKLALFISLSIIGVALVLTFSRGGWVVGAVGTLAFLVVQRRLRYAFIALFLMLAAAVFMPDAVVARLTAGMNESTMPHTPGKVDALTAGRVWLWTQLAPGFWHSPLWGSGVGSVAWSEPVKRGMFFVVHPHNVFLRIVLDLGLAGFALLFMFYRYLVRQAIVIARAPDAPPLMRALAQGLATAVVAMFLGDMAGGHYMAGPEQSVLWMAIGLLLPAMAGLEPKTRNRAEREAQFALQPAIGALPSAPERH